MGHARGGEDGRIQPGKLFSGIERFGDATALICAGGVRISYAQLAARADAAARQIGKERALVSIQLENDLDPIAMYIGALRAGHVVIPNDGGPAAKRITAIFKPNWTYAPSGRRWKLARGSREQAGLAPDLAILLSTSGSTGSPKLVRLSHENLRSNAQSIAGYLDFQPGERAITSLPGYYSYGLSVLHSHLMLGHTVVLSRNSVSEPAFWETVAREKVTSIAGVPHTYELIEHGGFLAKDYPDLRYLTQAGGKLAEQKIRKFAQWADQNGKRFHVMYGQTEAAPRMAHLPPEDAQAYADCIGVAVPGGRFRLEPMDDVAGLPEGAGELVYTGPNVMMGYAFSPEDLAKPAGPGELSTGDIAVCNERGYYRIVGRRSRFAKMFGLRLSFDDIERRLATAGIEAVVTGDDTRIVIATTKVGSTCEVSDFLSKDLGMPATVLSVMELATIPRLSSGKPDYAALRGLPAKMNAAPQSSFGAQIALILGQKNPDTNATFTELGGNSLTYVQMVLALEKFLGHVPDNWENTPVGDLEKLANQQDANTASGDARNPSLFFQGLDLARSIAIFLALLAHSFAQSDVSYPPEVYFLPKIATPLLIMLFGVMVPLLYSRRTNQPAPGQGLQGYLTSALQCYLLYCLSVFVIWLGDVSGWKYALRSLLFLGSMPYAQILVYYTIIFLALPILLLVLRLFSFRTLFAASLAVHAAFLLMKMVPAPPEVFGVPAFQMLMDLFVGMGSAPVLAGPSILHSLVLLLTGIWIGTSIRQSAGEPDPRGHFLRSQIPVAAMFGVGLVLAFSVPSYPVEWIALNGMDLRNLNHPVYVFFYGLLAFALLAFLLVFPGSARAPGWALTPGRRSLFAFGVGNAIIVAWPQGGFGFLPPIIDGLLLLALLMLLIYAFDYCLRTGPNAHGVARWVFEGTNWGARQVQMLAGLIVRALGGRQASRPDLVSASPLRD